MNVNTFVYHSFHECCPTHQIVHVSSRQHICPHVGVLMKEGVQ